MIVQIMNKSYSMSRQQYKKLLKVASEQVPQGVYAVEKNNYAELRMDKCKSITELKARIRAYKNQGLKVYSNGR